MRQYKDPEGKSGSMVELETDVEVAADKRHDELLDQGMSTLAAAAQVEQEFAGLGLSEEFHTWLRDGLTRADAVALLKAADAGRLPQFVVVDLEQEKAYLRPFAEFGDPMALLDEETARRMAAVVNQRSEGTVLMAARLLPLG